MISAREAQAFNNKVHTLSFVLPDASDNDDAHFFAIFPPPQIRPDTQSRPAHTDSVLCEICRSSLEYFAYWMEKSRLNRSPADGLKLSTVVAHHPNLYSLEASVGLKRHCCLFLAYALESIFKGMPEPFASVLQIELCWGSGTGMLDGKGIPGRARINLTLTDPTEERTSNNYFNFIRLQLWPAHDFASLFALPPEIRSSSPMSSTADDNGSFI